MAKNNFLKYTATLFIICLIASGLLSSVYNLTKGKIKLQQDNEKMESLKESLSGAQDFYFVDKKDKSYYIGKDKQGRIVGYAFIAEKAGYSSNIVTMVGITKEGMIQGIKILSQNETPGLGSKIVEIDTDRTVWDALSGKGASEEVPKPWFQAQFTGKSIGNLGETIETVTGATVSSEAVIDSIKEKAKIILEEIKDGR